MGPSLSAPTVIIKSLDESFLQYLIRRKDTYRKPNLTLPDSLPSSIQLESQSYGTGSVKLYT